MKLLVFSLSVFFLLVVTYAADEEYYSESDFSEDDTDDEIAAGSDWELHELHTVVIPMVGNHISHGSNVNDDGKRDRRDIENR